MSQSDKSSSELYRFDEDGELKSYSHAPSTAMRTVALEMGKMTMELGKMSSGIPGAQSSGFGKMAAIWGAYGIQEKNATDRDGYEF